MRINIGGLLTKRAAMTPDREGLVCEGIRRTYKQLNDRANRLANTMKALGVGYGDRVGILALNEPEYGEIQQLPHQPGATFGDRELPLLFSAAVFT